VTGVPFTRSHDVVIEAPGEAVYDYVTNPHSWPEWLAASHALECPDRPLVVGETFREFWSTRKGPVTLEWIVTESDRPKCWIGETGTDFTGPIVIRYDLAPEGGATRFTRTVSNPARPRPPTAEMIERMDAEAAQGLAAIKRIVEARG
jgi:uncharacterized protein YndB with AHSA1/START domain